ncbi:MAG: helix-turn-helix transcriptional regulator [Cytophagaceae bacterium]|nr:helix-turn-helix transcriptional regulator [Cytophagaceae bacterium]
MAQNQIIIHKISPLMFDYFDRHALTGEASDLIVSYPSKVIRGDGTEGWYLHQMKVLQTDEKKPILGLKIITDISDFKKDEIITIRIAKKDRNGIFENIFSQSFSEPNTLYNISEREREVLLLLDEGKSTLEIGTQLFISNHTVSTHRRNLLKKFEAKSTVDMLKKATAHGII